MLTFLCGGVRSGKSSYGESLAVKKKRDGGRLIYIATAVKTDEEMEERIAHHQRKRAQEADWHTLEKPYQLLSLIDEIASTDVVFLDCLTTWLSNEMFLRSTENERTTEIKERMIGTIEALHRHCSELLIISNDLFHEPVSEEESVRQYVQLLGELHQFIVKKAHVAIQMENGVPIYWKGR